VAVLAKMLSFNNFIYFLSRSCHPRPQTWPNRVQGSKRSPV